MEDSTFTERPSEDRTSSGINITGNTIVAGGNVYFDIRSAGDRRREELQKLSAWLSDLNPSADQKVVFDKVTPKTCLWVFEHPIFNAWLAKEFTVLWGVGKPGAGKTCVAAAVINHLQAKAVANANPTPVISIYCVYSMQSTLTTTKILACLLKQLVQRSEAALRYVKSNLEFEGTDVETTEPSQAELVTTLRGVARLFPEIFIIIDALDELQDDVRQELVDILVSLQRPLFITSRPLDISLPATKMEIQAPSTSLEAFIAHKMRGVFPSLLDSTVLAEIVTRLLEKCSGIFLLAALQVSFLKSKCVTNLSSLRKSVEELPTELDEWYEQTKKRIDQQSDEPKSLAYRAILFVTHAARFLHINELIEALLVDVERMTIEQSERTTQEILTTVSHGLLIVEAESGTIHLIHYTAQAFFERQKTDPIFKGPHTFMADISATYLTLLDIDAEFIVTPIHLQNIQSRFPFFDYAYWNLGYHMHRASAQGNECITKSVDSFFHKLRSQGRPILLRVTTKGMLHLDHGNIAHFAAYHGISSLLTKNDSVIIKESMLGCTPFFYACLGGNTTIVERLLGSDHTDASLKNVLNANALHAASEHGHESVVKLLLDHSANVRRQSRHHSIFERSTGLDLNGTLVGGETALYLACSGGHTSVIHLLLGQKGINVNTRGKDGKTALVIASRQDDEKLIRKLLELNGTDVNAGTSKGMNALMYASQNGNEAIVRILLDSSGVDFNAQATDGTTALIVASQNGNEAIVRLLLSLPGIDINARRKDGITALTAALMNGHEAIFQLLRNFQGIDLCLVGKFAGLVGAARDGYEAVVRMLLGSPGIDPNERELEKHGATALMRASENGHEAIVRLLLGFPGTDPNATNNNGWTALMLASFEGHETVVRMLLDFPGIDINAKTHDGTTALMTASYGPGRSEGVVRLLLNSPGIDRNARPNFGGNALMAAAQLGHEAIFRLLLDAGIDPNVRQNDDGWTMLMSASGQGYEAIVRLLLAIADVDPNAKSNDGFTALMVASQNGHEAVVRLLLDSRGIDINARSNNGTTALISASQSGHDIIVGLLLASQGIDPNLSTHSSVAGGTALIAASRDGHEAVVQLLLDSPDVHINAVTNQGRTALMVASQYGHETIVRLLLNAGIDANARAHNGITALMVASAGRQQSIVKALLSAPDINVNSQLKDGRTALSFAESKGHEGIKQLILNFGQGSQSSRVHTLTIGL